LTKPNRATLITNPYKVVLADGSEVVAWAIGKRNKYATLRTKIGGSWVVLGEWAWHVLEAYWNDPLTQGGPLRM
jgi:hypothetical protein